MIVRRADLLESIKDFAKQYDSDNFDIIIDQLESDQSLSYKDIEYGHAFELGILETATSLILLKICEKYLDELVSCLPSIESIYKHISSSLKDYFSEEESKKITDQFISILEKQISIKSKNNFTLLFSPYSYIYDVIKYSLYMIIFMLSYSFFLVIEFFISYIDIINSKGFLPDENIDNFSNELFNLIVSERTSSPVKAFYEVIIHKHELIFIISCAFSLVFIFLIKKAISFFYTKKIFNRCNIANGKFQIAITGYIDEIMNNMVMPPAVFLNWKIKSTEKSLATFLKKNIPAIILPERFTKTPLLQSVKFIVLHEIYHILCNDHKKNQRMKYAIMLFISISIITAIGATIKMTSTDLSIYDIGWTLSSNFYFPILLLSSLIFFARITECRADFFAFDKTGDKNYGTYFSSSKNILTSILYPSKRERTSFLQDPSKIEFSFLTIFFVVSFSYYLAYFLTLFFDYLKFIPHQFFIVSFVFLTFHMSKTIQYYKLKVNFFLLFNIFIKYIFSLFILFFIHVLIDNSNIIFDYNFWTFLLLHFSIYSLTFTAFFLIERVSYLSVWPPLLLTVMIIAYCYYSNDFFHPAYTVIFSYCIIIITLCYEYSFLKLRAMIKRK